ncbi:MAG: hemerythrin domain-containing protein [Bacteroidales bacterium]|jgi:regulator of cell morphogenesis and NO signaling|nr:hemerythrin domain-containing protein [Bacteroidales bacterium]
MQITKEMKMADAIHSNYLLLPVINRLEIQLGFQDKSIEKVCVEQNVDVEFFLTIINAFLGSDNKLSKQLQSHSVKEVVSYLLKTHSYYLERIIPEIENRINLLIQYSQLSKEEFLLVKNFFEEYEKELYAHIALEEEHVYPYILEIADSYHKKSLSQALENKINIYPITSYEKEHSDIEAKLFDLKNILIKYLPAPKDSHIRNRVLTELYTLEQDLSDHARIENMVLVPKITEMEAALLALKK